MKYLSKLEARSSVLKLFPVRFLYLEPIGLDKINAAVCFEIKKRASILRIHWLHLAYSAHPESCVHNCSNNSQQRFVSILTGSAATCWAALGLSSRECRVLVQSGTE